MSSYFVSSVVERGHHLLKPLSHQTLNGKPINASWDVITKEDIRTRYGMGTKFVTDVFIEKSGYYEASNLKVLLKGAPPADIASDQQFQDYRDFMRRLEVGSVEKETQPEKDNSVFGRMRRNKKYSPPTIEDNGFYVDPDMWYLFMRNMQNQVNTILIGPSGTGKTELVEIAAKKMGKSLAPPFDMGSMYDPVAGLLGTHRLMKKGSDVVSVFDKSRFAEAIQKDTWILLDELSRAPVATNNLLFPCLDSRRVLMMEYAEGKEERVIPVHPDCSFVATANIGAEYTGTMSLDRALMGRFFPIEMGFLPAEAETKVLEKTCSLGNREASEIVVIANKLRDLWKKQEISTAVSTRETKRIGELVRDGLKVVKAFEYVVLPMFEGTDVQGERSICRKVFTTR